MGSNRLTVLCLEGNSETGMEVKCIYILEAISRYVERNNLVNHTLELINTQLLIIFTAT